jgi:hypothetical protein
MPTPPRLSGDVALAGSPGAAGSPKTSGLPRTTPRTRRKVARWALAAVVAGILAALGMDGSFWFLLALPAMGIGFVAGTIGLKAGALTNDPGFWVERLIFVIVLWLGILRWTFDLEIITISGGDSRGSRIGLLLGAPWAWTAVGVWAFVTKRGFELERAALRRSSGFCSKPSSDAFVPIASGVLAAVLAAGVLATGGGPIATAVSTLALILGTVLLVTGFPTALRSRVGRAAFLMSHFVAAASAASVLTSLTVVLVMIESDMILQSEAELAGLFVAFALSYACFGLRLRLFKPFAAHTSGKAADARRTRSRSSSAPRLKRSRS